MTSQYEVLNLIQAAPVQRLKENLQIKPNYMEIPAKVIFSCEYTMMFVKVISMHQTKF